MNLNYDSIKNTSIEDIYQYFLKDYQKLFNNYKYAFKSYDDFVIILNSILKDIISNLPNNSSFDYQKYFLNQTQNKLNNYLKNLLNSDEVLTILNTYIIYNLDENSKDVLKELYKLIRLLQRYNYTPDPNLIIELVKSNEKLNNILAKIVQKNLTLIGKYGLDIIFENEIIYELIDVYCNLNNIVYDDVEKQNKQDLSLRYDGKTLEKFNDTYTGASAIINDIRSKDLYVLSNVEEKELALKIKLGDQAAYNKFLNHNLRLVVNIANRYINQGVEYEDLIQEGCIGLIKAIEKFDVAKDFKFSTYASWWVRQAIIRAIGNEGRNIRLPIHKLDELRRFKRKLAILKNNLGYEPSIEEIARHLEMPYDKVQEYIYLLQDTISLNSPISDEEETELENFIPNSSTTLEDDVIEKNLITEVDELLIKAGLTEMERDILKYRYGLNYREVKKLEDIGKIYGVTRERIRQKESAAIKKLRKSPLMKDFAYYLDNPDKSIEKLQLLINWHYKHPKSNTVYSIDADRLFAKREKSKRRIKLKTIYEQIPDYSKEEILNVIENLTKEDKEIFYLRNGEDLEHPVITDSWDFQKYKSLLYVTIFARIRKNIAKIKGEGNITMPKKLLTIYQKLNNHTKEDIDALIAKLPEEDKKIFYLRNGEDLEHPVSSVELTSNDKVKYYKIVNKMARQLNYSKENILTKKENNNPTSVELIEFYLRTIALLKSPQFMQLLLNNTIKDAIILAIIINSYLEKITLKVEDIASLLNEDIDIIRKDLKRVLILFNNNITDCLNNTINKIETNENSTIKR